ncbi:Uncharacterised protein [Yersinia frederiksenii]|nr:Uncharacterised protein [Yersinia frederiksenii]
MMVSMALSFAYLIQVKTKSHKNVSHVMTIQHSNKNS